MAVGSHMRLSFFVPRVEVAGEPESLVYVLLMNLAGLRLARRDCESRVHRISIRRISYESSCRLNFNCTLHEIL